MRYHTALLFIPLCCLPSMVVAQNVTRRVGNGEVIRRDQQSDGPTDPEELKATVGADGRVAFQFRNQPWEELIGSGWLYRRSAVAVIR